MSYILFYEQESIYMTDTITIRLPEKLQKELEVIVIRVLK